MLRWKPLTKNTIPTIVECCKRTTISDVLVCAVPRKDQKRGQPPYRYRCVGCGPTQEPRTPGR